MDQLINTNPLNILVMSVVSPNLSDQLLNRQVMELQYPDSMQQPESARDSVNNVADEDHRGGGADDSNHGSEDEDDLLLAPMTPNQLICIMCGTRVASTERLRRHTVKHHPEDAEMFEFLIGTAVKIFPGIYAENQAQTSNPSTSKVNSVDASAKKSQQNDFHLVGIQPESEISTSVQVGVGLSNSDSTEVSTKFPNVVTAPEESQISEYCHAKKKPFKCEYCGAGWTCKGEYKRHLLTHTGERHFICEVCGNGFKLQCHLKAQMLVHTGEKLFVCQQCNKALSSARILRDHVLRHKQEVPIACPHCDNMFMRKTRLKEHLATHSGELALPCPQCGKVFFHKSSLVNHLKTHLRRYACDQCPKTFSYRRGFRQHLKVHTGEKPQ